MLEVLADREITPPRLDCLARTERFELLNPETRGKRWGDWRLFFIAERVDFCGKGSVTVAGGIGGEYSAVNSTIQEMIPARYRAWTDLAINDPFVKLLPLT